MYFMSQCNELGIPKFRPITCRICGFIAKSERSYNSHKGNAHHKGDQRTQHDEDLFKSGKYTYE